MYTSPGNRYFINSSYLEMVATSYKGSTFGIVEYLSGPSLYVEWTNWSKILASYSDMYTSPGNRYFINSSYLEMVATSYRGSTFGICRVSVWSLTVRKMDQLFQIFWKLLR